MCDATIHGGRGVGRIRRDGVRFLATLLAFSGLAALRADTLNAQQVRQDPATGHYYVVVYDDDLRPVEILVENAGLAELSVAPVIRRTPAGLRYTYEATVLPGSPQGLRMLQVDCPGSEDAIRDLTAVTLADGDTLWTERGDWAQLPTCFVEFGVIPLNPGESVRAGLTSTLRPAIGEARGLGAIRGVSWPTSDPIEENDAARAFARSVQGITGGWKSVPTVVPARDPALLDDPARGLGLVREDLGRACGELGRITSQGVCRSLEAKLEAAERSRGRGQTAAAREQLESFLAEFEAQHGEPPGKHVNEAAYWLLRTNVEYLLERL
ncbi:MAG TPA: hypothetical protein VF158_09255 [Longimicrobiales bacterium]